MLLDFRVNVNIVSSMTPFDGDPFEDIVIATLTAALARLRLDTDKVESNFVLKVVFAESSPSLSRPKQPTDKP